MTTNLNDAANGGKAAHIATLMELQRRIAGMMPGDDEPDAQDHFFDQRRPWDGRLLNARHFITQDKTTTKQARTIAKKAIADIERDIVVYQRSKGRIISKMKRQRQERIEAKAERRQRREDLRQAAIDQFPELIDRDDFIVVDPALMGGTDTDAPLVLWPGFPADIEAKATNGNGHHVNGEAKAKKRVSSDFNFDPRGDEMDRPVVLKPGSEGLAASEDEETNDHFPVDPVNILDPSYQTPALPLEYLPTPLREYVAVQAKWKGVDPAGVAMAALAALAGVIPDMIKLKMKRHDDWMESARIWVALIGEPSTKKSPIFHAALKPVNRLDAALYEDWREAMDEWEAMSDEDRKACPKPARMRYVASDSTIEALQNMLRDVPKALVAHDELSGLFGAMDKYNGSKGGMKDRSLYLSAYNGGSFPVDRVQRGSFLIPNWSMVIIGGIQPTAIQKVSDDNYDDGMLQRVNVVCLQDAGIDTDEAAPDIIGEYADLVETCSKLKPPLPDNSLQTVGNTIPHLRFDREAQELRNQLAAKHLDLMKLQSVNKKLAGHIGKFDGMFGRYCVLFHCIEHAKATYLPTVITIETARRAADFLHRFLLPHAMCFYLSTLGTGDHHQDLMDIAGLILARNKPRITLRDTQRASRNLRRLDHSKTRPLFESLETLGWLVPIHERTATSRKGQGGYKTSRVLYWAVNPKVHELFAEQAKSEKAKRDATIRLIQEQVATLKPSTKG